MKTNKKILLLVLLLVIVTCGCMVGVIINNLYKVQLKSANGEHLFVVSVGDIAINSVDEWNMSYICFPSYITTNYLIVDDSLDMKVNGTNPGRVWHFRYDTIYNVTTEKDGVNIETALMFKHSAAVNTMYINTVTGSMDNVLANKENKEAATATIMDVHGKEVYAGSLEYIKGRGNSTWSTFIKKPYAIKFPKKMSLFGMTEQKKYVLLANAFDRSGLSNYIAYHWGHELGLSQTPKCEFVDLYLNGNYVGNYLLCDSVSMKLLPDVADNSQVASEHYIIEKDLYYSLEQYNFVTEHGNAFSMKEPEQVSEAELTEIKNQIQRIEDMIFARDDKLFDYLDLDTFAKRYLIDRVLGNVDTAVSSMFFYKIPGDDKIYSGPLWDYDRCFGLMGWQVCAPDLEMEQVRTEVLNWYEELEQNAVFTEYCKALYTNQIRSEAIALVKTHLDEYANRYAKAIDMDHAVNYEIRSYNLTWEANLKYIKYYVNSRIRMYDQKYHVEESLAEFQGDGTEHTIIVMVDDETFIYTVLDGQCFTIPIELDEELYDYWCTLENESIFEENIPVFENKNIVAHPRYAGED